MSLKSGCALWASPVKILIKFAISRANFIKISWVRSKRFKYSRSLHKNQLKFDVMTKPIPIKRSRQKKVEAKNHFQPSSISISCTKSKQKSNNSKFIGVGNGQTREKIRNKNTRCLHAWEQRNANADNFVVKLFIVSECRMTNEWLEFLFCEAGKQKMPPEAHFLLF